MSMTFMDVVRRGYDAGEISRSRQVEDLARRIEIEEAKQRQHAIWSGGLAGSSVGLAGSSVGLAGFGSSSLGSDDGDDGGFAEFKESPIKVPKKPGTEMLQEKAAPELDLENGRVGLAIQSEDLLGYTPLRDDVKAPSRLTRLLAALDIRVYEIATVQEYKARMQAHFQALADKKDREDTKNRGFSRTVTRCKWEMIRLSGYTKPVPEYVLAKCVEIKQKAPEATFWVNELREEKRTLDPFMVVCLGEKSPDNNEHAYFEVWDEAEFEATL